MSTETIKLRGTGVNVLIVTIDVKKMHRRKPMAYSKNGNK